NRTTPGLLSVCVYHGNYRGSLKASELAKFDVVLSTYALVENGYRKQQYGSKLKNKDTGDHKLVKATSILHEIKWERVVLDEAHAIKDRSCSTARAVFALNTPKRWSLSGIFQIEIKSI
ncbi:DNA repair protein rad16, partial [Nowakowskiella sp. JEL0078]